MSQLLIAHQSCTLVAVNAKLASQRLNFDVMALMEKMVRECTVRVVFWNHIDFVPQDIFDLASEIKEVQKHFEHSRAVLFGTDLENHITAIGLRFMAEGLETYLLKDLTISLDGKFEATHEMRLFSVGVIPTTFSQVMMEWIAFESDPMVKQKLIDSLTFYRNLTVGAPH